MFHSIINSTWWSMEN